MPTQIGNYNIINADTLNTKKVVVRDASGNIVFNVDENDISIQKVDVVPDFLKLGSVNISGDGVLKFLNGEVISVPEEKVNRVNYQVVNADFLESRAFTGKFVNGDNGNFKNLETEMIDTKKILNDVLVTNKIETKVAKVEHLETDCINAVSVQGSNGMIKNLTAVELNAPKGKMEILNTTDLETLKANVENLKSKNAVIEHLVVNNLEDKTKKDNTTEVYGSKEEPLYLALTQQAQLELKNNEVHKIYTKVPNGVNNIKFKLLNFNEGYAYVSGTQFATICIVDDYVVVKLDTTAQNDTLIITINKETTFP